MEMKQLLLLMESAQQERVSEDIHDTEQFKKYLQYMPNRGPSDRLVGEIFRAANKIVYDHFNNGFGNDWSEAAAFLMKHINFPGNIVEMFLTYGLGKPVEDHQHFKNLEPLVNQMLQITLDELDQMDPETPNPHDMWKTDISPYDFLEPNDENWGEEDDEDGW